MQPGKDFRVRKTKITRYIFKYITWFWTLKSTSILGGSFTWIVTSALFPQTVWWVSPGSSPLAMVARVHVLKLCDVLMVEPLLHLEHLQRCTGQRIFYEEKSKHVSSLPSNSVMLSWLNLCSTQGSFNGALDNPFWMKKSQNISALFPQNVWCSHGWTFAPLRATPTVHWTTHFGWRKVKTY
jgi:hypothetical protein